VTNDEALIAALKTDYTTALLAPADRAMLDYVAKLTLTPAEMTRADVETLRAHGFEDQAILQIVLIASFFAYYNRVADALGLAKD
jgi:uncharacterized peroxidase-related enzyme